MTQYTIEHTSRQGELVAKETSLYGSQNIYVLAEDEDVKTLLALRDRYGVTVRESTKEEVDYVWDLEVEMEYHEPNVTRDWPEEEGEIILEIKDW